LRNKIFDLVLNLNTLNNVKGDLAKLQDKIKIREEEKERELTMNARGNLARRNSYNSEGSEMEEEEAKDYETESDSSSDNDGLFGSRQAPVTRAVRSAAP